MASAIARRAWRLAFPANEDVVADRRGFPSVRDDEHRNAARHQKLFRRPAFGQSRRIGVTDDDEIAMERVQHRVVIGSVAPDHPEFRADTLLQRKRRKEAVNNEGFLFLGCPKSGEDAVDRHFATRKGIGRMLCGIAGHAVDPDQVLPTKVSQCGGGFTDILAFRGVIENDCNAFPAGQHLFHR
jgi:hypothetical protein